MRVGGRMAAAIEVLDDIEKRHRPVSEALKDWGLSHRFAGAGDRAAIGNIVYDALRRKRSHQFMFDAETSRALVLGVMVRQWGFGFDKLAAELDGDKFAPEPPKPEEVALFQSRDLADAPDGARADCPDWIVLSLQHAFGEDWVAEMDSLNGRPPLDLRANTLKAGRDKVVKALDAAGAKPCEIAPHGIRIAAGEGPSRQPNVTVEPAWQKGWFEVQDEGSQIAALLAGAHEGIKVLDYCAGAGGKTLAMAAAMGNKGQIHAFDADKSRLAPIFDRLRRAGTRNVQVHAKADELAALEGKMDLVLVDAPCTGTGTWRRRPDTKWKLTPESLGLRLNEQQTVLENARRYVRPGGRLVYITCSVLTEENTDRVTAFLESAPEFSSVPPAEIWRAAFGDAHAGRWRDAGNGLLLTPALTGTDGFFVSVLTRS